MSADSDRPNPSSPNGEQLKRYRAALPNLIFTNYTEFHWYVNGVRRSVAVLADNNVGGKLTVSRDDISVVSELLSAFFAENPEPVFKSRRTGAANGASDSHDT